MLSGFNIPPVSALQAQDVITYLQLTGWRLIDESNDRWFVFHGERDVSGNPLEIVIPKDFDVPDLPAYLEQAINILSVLDNEHPKDVMRRVVYYDSDVLSIRNLEETEYSSIVLRQAATQVNELKGLVTYATCSERDPRPYFGSPIPAAKKMTEKYRFGHTFSGSFGFTIVSPIRSLAMQYEMNLDGPGGPIDDPIVVAPVERRVMERIMRGLKYTREATTQRDPQVLVKEYSGGFNSNMCSRVVGLSIRKTLPIEFSVTWSPKIAPPEDLSEFREAKTNAAAYEYLEEAATVLRGLKPEYVTIQGLVTHLSSQADPLGDSIKGRSVVIRWTDIPRPHNVAVALDKDDYVIAHKAHMTWSTVQVSGILQKTGNLWRLSGAFDLTVLN